MTKTLDILDRLIALPSVSADSNLGVIGYIEDFLTGRGFAVHRIADDTGAKAGLFARIGPAEGQGIMLSGHTDVVPVAGQPWTTDPFRLARKGDRLFGRGTADMKGYLACMLSAADRAAQLTLRQPLKLAFSWDEEVGCVGIPQMLPKLAETIGKPALCIVGEPTNMQIALGHKGKAALRASVNGQSGHSAMAPDYVNAIHVAGDFIARLRDLQASLATTGARDPDYGIPYSTVHVGKITGGTALNIVPDQVVIDFEYRYPAAQSSEAILSAIETAAEVVATQWRDRFAGVQVAVAVVNAYPGLAAAPDGPEALLMHRLHPGATFIQVGYGTEAGHFAGAGVPTVVCGPGSMDQGHKPDEFIEVSELVACDAMCERILQHLGT